ncbi:hypothetical protein, partial [Collinsella aerofaciens]|uniref:hypothetical protein n=1 Tax=Collinsella aerofaciens TaxID=74426 RepID=UPI001E339685
TVFQIPGRRADSLRIGRYTNFLDITLKIDINEQPACICKMLGLMSDALSCNESKSSNVINL